MTNGGRRGAEKPQHPNFQGENAPCDRPACRGWRGSADCQSAIRQDIILRYEGRPSSFVKLCHTINFFECAYRHALTFHKPLWSGGTLDTMRCSWWSDRHGPICKKRGGATSAANRREEQSSRRTSYSASRRFLRRGRGRIRSLWPGLHLSSGFCHLPLEQVPRIHGINLLTPIRCLTSDP